MCLYPRLMKNPRYLPNKKNNNRPPKCTDFRLKYVSVGCGNCIECRLQKAHEWQIRLMEEIKCHKYNYFITLTFDNKNLKELCKETEQKECNAIATIAVRRFLERWRKKHKKSIKHWLITELGHNGTERIHLHGIIFSEEEVSNETLQKYWAYGLTDNGKYVNERTINYIIKYVTKIDNDHKGYKPIILCSAGLGKSYIENEFYKSVHQFKPKQTKETYTLKNGSQTSLPIYYRNKLWTEKEREQLWLEKINSACTYVRGIEIPKINTEEGYTNYIRTIATQQEKNIALGYGTPENEWKEKEYNITFKMLNKKVDFAK